ncbi:MAG: glucose dehydrogenase [Acidobacteria bacterium]|nr:MAG: glucose dehydrogenase [Acidobacteriota bacterium]PYR49016.1 MAG: glucose dehydrogenase [Acidobacteriota bacterium]
MRRSTAGAVLGLVIALTILLLAGTGEAQSGLSISVHATGFTTPVAVVQDPTNRAVQFVVEQGGRIGVAQSGARLPTDFLNLAGSVSSGGERGLLGMALAPDYASSGRFYVNFTNSAGHTVVARFRRSATPLVADAASRFDLRWPTGNRFIEQPYVNHNGGNLMFGPDGFLYIGMGDGGSANDPENRAQTPGTLLGKMLRIDVNVPDDPNPASPTTAGYNVPANNPFVSSGPAGTLPEIWSFGLRNPWRFSFDDPSRGGTGALVIGDVGQGSYEEVDYEPAGRGGRNYGWRNREGAHDNVTSSPPVFLPLTEPIHEYNHSVGQSITGGFVYRGRSLPATFQGRYFFADFIRGRVWSMGLTIDGAGEAHAANVTEHTGELGGSTQLGNVSSFGIDTDGELFIVSYSTGRILRIISLTPAAPTGLRIVRP